MPKHSPIRKLPPAKYLHECFTYNRKTGELRWKVRPRGHFATTKNWKINNNRFAGKLIKHINKEGYPCAAIKGKLYRAHRLIWKMVTGKEPTSTIDHCDGNPANNRFHNLRTATQREQMMNKCRQKNNTSGVTGVRKARNGKWQVQIGRTFDTFDAAVAARAKAAQVLFGIFYRE